MIKLLSIFLDERYSEEILLSISAPGLIESFFTGSWSANHVTTESGIASSRPALDILDDEYIEQTTGMVKRLETILFPIRPDTM